MALAEFWPATPRETVAFIEAAAWRGLQQERTAVTTAWFSEAFARTKRLKPLDITLREIFQNAGLDHDEKRARFLERMEAARDWARRHNASLKAKANG